MESRCHHVFTPFFSFGRRHFARLVSLANSFRLRQFCSLLFGLFWLVPVFVEVDPVLEAILSIVSTPLLAGRIDATCCV
jgi:hypothetical protein